MKDVYTLDDLTSRTRLDERADKPARLAVLGNPVAPLSWIVVVSFTVIGFFVARLMTRRYARLIPLWI